MTKIKFNGGICFTFIVVCLASLLILSLVVISRWITIEMNIKNQFKMEILGDHSKSSNRNHIPTWNDEEKLNKDISQLYYYHDCCYREDYNSLPGKLECRIKYNNNKITDTPFITIFSTENEGDKILYCIFRSTKTKTEMKRDVEFTQTNNIHDGFRKVYNDIIVRFLNEVKEVQSDKIILFGHSLGGSIVDLVSSKLMSDYPEIWKKTFSFSSGSPRVYTPAYSDLMSKHKNIDRYVKIINEADMVNQLPATVTVLGGFFGSGTKYIYKSFFNEKRTIRFNEVIETQLLDSHISKTYSDFIWSMDSKELPYLDLTMNKKKKEIKQ